MVHTVKTDLAVDTIPRQVSFNPEDPRIVLITGKNIYQYLKMNQNFQMQPAHSKLIKKDNNFSTDYTAHGWIDKRIIVCSSEGNIFLAETSGEYKMILPSQPGTGFKIQ